MKPGSPLPGPGVRRFPRVVVTPEQVRSLLAPLYGANRVQAVEPVEGGLTNTILRISLADGSPLLLRVFAAGRSTWEKERHTLRRVGKRLPVPELLLEDDGRRSIPYPSLLFRWTEGITLNAFRRLAHPSTLLLLAEALGELLANVASIPFVPELGPDGDAPEPESGVGGLLALAEERLRSGRARTRLGAGLADGLWHRLASKSVAFHELGPSRRLVHGDLGGRNVLVAQAGTGAWRIAALLDWEDAFAGWPLWDVGSLFRYRRRYGPAFRASFSRGYHQAGGCLPRNWWRTSRLLDATRQIATLSEERDRPEVFADCREILEALVVDDG